MDVHPDIGLGEEGDLSILQKDVDGAIRMLKNRTTLGMDTIPFYLIKQCTTIDILTKRLTNETWQTGQWPSTWTGKKFNKERQS